ncbi:hypothetical protein ABFS83_14G157600 [Erythranthe nasuta]
MEYFMLLVIILSFLSFSFLSTAHSLTELSTESNGFTTDLIHRDSIISPFYNPTSSHQDRIIKALQRSKLRADYFSLSSSASGIIPSAEMIAARGVYLMKLNVGTPPIEIHLYFDTGSIVTWTQCAPCYNCFRQNLPLFNPKASSTYKTVSSNSKTCKSVDGSYSRARDNTCSYALTYMNKSYSRGIVSSDTLRFNSTVLRDFIFGCGYENAGTYGVNMCGIIGLGKGQGSLITQMGPRIGGKFSYCLRYHDPFSNSSESSKIHFGNKAVVSGSGSVSTRLYFFRHVYAVGLKGISVGKKKLVLTNSLSNSSKILGLFNEKIIVDSGATLTYLPKKMYSALEAAMRKEIKLQHADPVDEMLRVCYKAPPDGKMKGIPVVTFHFVGADVKLSALNTFLKVSESVYCLGFVPRIGVTVFGNLAQLNFLVGYDIKKMTISFKPTDCSKP